MDFGTGSIAAEADECSVAPAAHPRERRLQIRAYNHWASLLNGRELPSIDDLDLDHMDFGAKSLLLDFTTGTENPAITFIGRELRKQCQLAERIQHIKDVPPRSLLSRLTDHYLQIIANRVPVGFEAEFMNERGAYMMYRGILMPFSSDGEMIDYVYGAINWKEGGAGEEASVPDEAPTGAYAARGQAPSPLLPAEADEEDEQSPIVPLDEDAALADRLSVARDGAEAAKSADARSRAALYDVLCAAYDFALAAEANQEDYAELLSDAGLKVQARAPMTAVVKLIFGVNYEKARVTEFAAALSYGRRQDLPFGAFRDYLDNYQGGIKAMVKAERIERGSPARARPDPLQPLRSAQPLAYLRMDAEGEEFVLLVARRTPEGGLAVVAAVAPDQALLDNAARKCALPDSHEEQA